MVGTYKYAKSRKELLKKLFPNPDTASKYVSQLIRQYNSNKGYKSDRRVAARTSAKNELKRLGYTVTGRSKSARYSFFRKK
jgi:hypothetical protein|tara:strand:- start:242 stop:484 length:243 start_codon:yes stop_codon:yes gene_type:complete